MVERSFISLIKLLFIIVYFQKRIKNKKKGHFFIYLLFWSKTLILWSFGRFAMIYGSFHFECVKENVTFKWKQRN